jgi:hypothetical protein
MTAPRDPMRASGRPSYIVGDASRYVFLFAMPGPTQKDARVRVLTEVSVNFGLIRKGDRRYSPKVS